MSIEEYGKYPCEIRDGKLIVGSETYRMKEISMVRVYTGNKIQLTGMLLVMCGMIWLLYAAPWQAKIIGSLFGILFYRMFVHSRSDAVIITINGKDIQVKKFTDNDEPWQRQTFHTYRDAKKMAEYIGSHIT